MIGRIAKNLGALVLTSLVLAAGGLGPRPAQAQFQALQTLERLEVVIWPEYDQPATLVILRGWLPPDTALPTTVALPMPSTVAAPSAVAKRPIGGDLLLTPYTVEAGDGVQWVYIQTDAPEARLEYYTDLSMDAASRTFDFEWPGGPAINQIAYEVMQPIGASELTVAPSSGRPQLAPDGLVYQREEIGGVPEGGQFFINVQYSKATSALTVSALSNMQPVAPPPPTTPQDADSVAVAQPQDPDQPSGAIWATVLPVMLVAGIIVVWFILRAPKVRD